VLDPFHVVRWASNMLDECRRRVQHDILGRRGRKNDPLYKSRRTLLTRISYLSDANKSNCSSCLQMSTTSKWIAPGACTNGWSAPTTSRIENVVKTHGRGHKYHYSQRLAQSAHRGERLGETLKNTLRASLPTSTGQEPATVQQKLSTGDLSTYEVPPWALEI
jgi:hypothetical protein